MLIAYFFAVKTNNSGTGAFKSRDEKAKRDSKGFLSVLNHTVKKTRVIYFPYL